MTSQPNNTEAPVYAGAFEIYGITGVSLARGPDVAGIRLAYPHPALGLFDDKYVLLLLDKTETHAPDQSYVRYSWQVPVTPAGLKKVAGWPCKSVNGPVVFDFEPGEAVRITLEWGVAGDTVCGRYTASGEVRVGLFVNGCFARGSVIAATPESCSLTIGDSTLHAQFVGTTETPLCVNEQVQGEQAWAGIATPAGSAMALMPVSLAPGTPLYFSMTLSGDATSQIAAPEAAAVDIALAAAASAYNSGRMRSTGLCAGAAEAVAGLSGYSRTYDPGRGRLQTTVNRTWGGPNRPGIIFGWDNFFTSYIAAWEDPDLGAASLEHIVSVYGEQEIARGPVQRNLIIPVMYTRTLDVLGDDALAERTWPTMMEFMRFWFSDRGDGHPWRDGNDNGLIESGSNGGGAPGIIIQAAMDETGYDDLPNKSAGFTEGRLGMTAEGVDFDWDRRTLTLTEVGQNSMYAASCLAMKRWALRLGKGDDANWLAAEAERVATAMRDRLYCEEDGIFRDRFGDGRFSQVSVMTLFFPLLAGVADDDVKTRLREMLLDPDQFWTEHVMPTVSRSDPAYCDGLDGRGNYWRGNCWAPATYMVYLAIKEAGWDDIAADYAKKTCTQFLKYWHAHGHAYENFPPEGDVDHRFLYVQPWGGREVRYVWSAMNLFCGLEELFATEAVRDGVRFGNPHLAEESEWAGFGCAGTRVDAAAGPARTHVKFGDQWEFSAEPGVAVRECVTGDGHMQFKVCLAESVSFTIRVSDMPEDAAVKANGDSVAAESDGDSRRFSLPPGRYSVSV